MEGQPPPEPERAQLDGVPAFFAELPGAFSAAIMFRTGRSDEPFGCLGISHLVEHLALFALGNPSYAHNGFVDLTRTVFYASGTREEVGRFLHGVCRALARLPLGRLERERRVLRTELAGNDPGFYGRLFEHRFGAAGPGLLNFQDMGLHWLGAEQVSEWAAERYTRGNAVLWMSGPPPDELELPLPGGERVPLTTPASLRHFTEPLYLAEGTGGVGIGMVGRRSSALSCALRLAAERAVARLRIEQGISYSVGTDYLPLDGELAHVILSADCLDEHAARVLDGLLAVFEELGGGGATEQELALDRRRVREAMSEPDHMRGELDRAATNELHGWPHWTSEEILAEYDALTPAHVAEELTGALATRLVVAPEGIPPPPGHGRLEGAVEEPVQGREFVTRRGGVRRRPAARVIVGDEGVTLVPRGAEPVTVRFASVAGAVHGVPGQITLLARDGSYIEITFDGMRDGAELERLIVERLPPPGAVPGPQFEAARSVEAVAGRDLKRRWSVSDELESLKGKLRDGERLEHLALASRGRQAGLLALTNRRVLWLYAGVRGRRDDVWEAPRDAIANVESSERILWIRDATLRVWTPNDDLKLSGIGPRRKFGELVAALSGGSG